MESNLSFIHTRELFNLVGAEKLLLNGGSTDIGNISLDTLKEWVLLNIKQDLNLNLVTNTSDTGKPLSVSQKLYVDGVTLSLINQLNVLSNYTQALEIRLQELENKQI